jgi:hypothetical protein
VARKQPPAPKPALVHIRDEQFTSRALCGIDWHRARGGNVASDGFDPPVVRDEAGSVKACTCKTCLAVWRRRLAGGTAP